MSKLFNLKEWLTLADAARHLSIVCGEDLVEADLLRLALDGHLRLSVNLVNHAYARHRRLIPIGEARTMPSLTGKGTVLLGLVLNEREVLDPPDGPVVELTGVWDLTMIGGERLDVEHSYHDLTNGPKVTLINLEGTFVASPEGEIYGLLADFADTEDSQEKYKRLPLRDPARYYPAGGLPDDSVLVVRSKALREFEMAINGTSISAEKPLAATERNTLLTIIAALCDYSAIDYKGRGAAIQISKLTEEIGAAVSDDTVRRWLKVVPDALASRMK